MPESRGGGGGGGGGACTLSNRQKVVLVRSYRTIIILYVLCFLILSTMLERYVFNRIDLSTLQKQFAMKSRKLIL